MDCSKGVLSRVGTRGHATCHALVLKSQNSYEFIYDLKNSNSIQEFMGVYWLK